MKKVNKDPLFRTFKRDAIPRWKGWLYRVIAVLIAFIISITIASIVVKDNPFNVIKYIFQGAFTTNRNQKLPWKLFQDTAILLCFGIAIVPPFKMKYWNMGANGQVLIGMLASIVIMFKLSSFGDESSFNNILVILLMFVASVLASVIWALIPALFKAFFKTNETLFTLMMNYIAAALVGYTNYVLAKGKQEAPGIINMSNKVGWLAPHAQNKYIIPILIILAITVLIYFYMSKTKHGYEISVVGDSINTAKYVGMNTKFIIIRTLIISGIITGILGFIYASAINHSMSAVSVGSLGFTGVLIAWLSNFNPLIMCLVSLFLTFITLGTSKVSSKYLLGSNNLSNVIIGLIFFAILISEFFIRYTLKIRKKKKENKAKEVETC